MEATRAALKRDLGKETIRKYALQLGLDLVGFATTSSFEEDLRPDYRPSRIAPHLNTMIVVAKKNYSGVRRARHKLTQQFWGGRLIKHTDHCCIRLVQYLEDQGAAAYPVSSLMVDYAGGDGLDLCPAGQGSPLVKSAAVAAGLGTLGLNNMLLTRAYGPRVYLGGVLTDLAVSPDASLEEELCPGLEECGLCAAICPADAIPRQSRLGSALSEYRGLDAPACAEFSQPLGLRKFKDHLKSVFKEREDIQAMWEQVGNRTTGALWQEMIMIKEGVFTGCSECVNVCPAGEDSEFANLASSLNRRISGDLVQIDRIEPLEKEELSP